MKKLIAIVISLIFIFEGTGYCLTGNTLRPRLIYNKALSNEIKIDTVNWDLVTDPSQEPLKLVRSYSGIRGIFGEEEWITEETKIIILGFPYTYARDLIGRWLPANPDKKRFKLLIGRETRHTGEVIKDLHIAGFKLAAEDMGVEVEIIDLGIVTTPFIESAIRTLEADGGVMITASHNEPEFNGFKYLTGFEEPEQSSLNKGGGILNSSKKGVIIKKTEGLLKSMARGEHNLIERANQMLRESGVGHKSDAEDKLAKASEGYRSLPRKVFRLSEERVQQIRAFNDTRKNKMVYDSNGGGGYKIIPELLRDFIEVKEINNTPGKFVHKIEPVGDALLDATKEVERLKAILGLATDCDADRGNLTDMDPQDVVLLNVAGMLAWITANIDLYPEAKNKKWAIVTHDATSLRTAEVAEKFGAEVFEVEIGEVNVFTKMHDLEQKGYFVPIGVEGYNGGSIFMGTEVRDGALTALISILMLSDKKVFEVLLDKMGIKDQKIENAPSSPQDILNILPKYYTIQKDFKEEGVTASSEVIKARLEAAFTKRIKEDSNKGTFKIEGLWDKEFKEYKFLNYEETRVLEGMGNRVTQTGGFKILLTDTDDKKHFIWFRGSKTELGVFRAAIDSPDNAVAENLANFQKYLYQYVLYGEGSDERFYSDLATKMGLKGIAIDIGSGGNDKPAKGLLKGGLSQVMMVDNIFLPVASGQVDKINEVRGDATSLVEVFGEHKFDVAVFNKSLYPILELVEETEFGQELIKEGEREFFFVEILDRIISQTYSILKPGGTLLIKESINLIHGRVLGFMEQELQEVLARHRFTNIKVSQINNEEALITANVPLALPVNAAIKETADSVTKNRKGI